MEIAGYRVAKPLADDSYSTLYLAQRDELEERYVIRVLAEARAADKAYSDAFLRGAKQAAVSSHPGLLRVLEYGEHEGRPFYVVDYVGGGTLADKRHDLCLLDKVSAVKQVAKTLAFLARFGVPHGNVNPTNIFIREQDGSAVLAGFGFEPSALREAAETTLEVGSPASYLSPEQWLGDVDCAANYLSPEQWLGEAITFRSDIYSLGAVLYVLLADHPPHDALTILELKELFKGTFDAAAEKRLPPGKAIFEDIIVKSLSRSAEARFESVMDFVVALEAIADEDIIAADEHGEVTNTVVVDAQSAVKAIPEAAAADEGIVASDEEGEAASTEAAGSQSSTKAIFKAAPVNKDIAVADKKGEVTNTEVAGSHSATNSIRETATAAGSDTVVSRDAATFGTSAVTEVPDVIEQSPETPKSGSKPKSLKPRKAQVIDDESGDSRASAASIEPEEVAITLDRGTADKHAARTAKPAVAKNPAIQPRPEVRPRPSAAKGQSGGMTDHARTRPDVHARPANKASTGGELLGTAQAAATESYSYMPQLDDHQSNRVQLAMEEANWDEQKSPWRSPILVSLVTLAFAATIYLLPADLQQQLFEQVILPIRQALTGSG